MSPKEVTGKPKEHRIPEPLHAHEWVEVGSCPVCGSGRQHHRHFERIDTDERPLDYWLCHRCGMVFQSPRLTDRSLEEFYEEIYHQHMMPEAEDVARNEWVLDQRARHLAAFAQQHVQEVSVLLDVGSSRGHVLAAFKNQYGAEAFAVEPGSAVRPDVAHHAKHVAHELEGLPAALIHHVDLAVLSHVLEHFSHPRNFLTRLRETWLDSEGWVLVEVPNLLWHSALELSHLTAFTATSLTAMVESAGYRLLHLKAHGRPYSHRFPLFLLALVKPDSQVNIAPRGQLVNPAWWLRWRRRFNRGLYRIVQRILGVLRSETRFFPWME